MFVCNMSLNEKFEIECEEERERLAAAYNIDPADPDNVLDCDGDLVIDSAAEYQECKAIVKG